MTEGWVYFVRRGEAGSIKIGWTSKSVARRVASLQSSGSEELRIVRTLRGSRSHEEAWHSRYPHLRERGEWFAPADELTSRIYAYADGGQSPDKATLFADIERTHPAEVRRWYLLRGMSDASFAEAVGYSPTYLPEHLRGGLSRFSPRLALAIERITRGEIKALSLIAYAVSA